MNRKLFKGQEIKDLMNNLIYIVIVGLAIHIFDRLLDRQLSIMETHFWNFIRRSRNSPPPVMDPRYFKLGSFETEFLIIDGSGEFKYEPDDLILDVNEEPVELPSEIVQIRDQLKLNPSEWNGPMCTLEKHTVTRTSHDERMKLLLTLQLSDYKAFKATVLSLDRNFSDQSGAFTLRQRYLQGHDPYDLGQNPMAFLANGVGIALLVITKDRKALIGHRAEKVGPRAGQLDISVAEGIHPQRDEEKKRSSMGKKRIDIFKTVYGGIEEELEIKRTDIRDIALLGFGVDMKYYQWIIVGTARINKTAQEVLEGRSRGAKGKWENRTFYPISIEPEIILSYLNGREMWDTAWVTIYLALVYEWGKERINFEWKKRLFRKGWR